MSQEWYSTCQSMNTKLDIIINLKRKKSYKPNLSFKPTVHLKTPPNATSSPKITENEKMEVINRKSTKIHTY